MIYRLLLLFAAGISVAHGQAPPHLDGAHMPVPPVIDGKFDGDEWKAAAHVTTFVDPVSGTPPQDPTEAWLGYDDQAIYIAFFAHDSRPNEMVGREIRAGAEFNGEDTVQFRINPFGTRSWDGTSRFTVNLLNTQSDQIAGGRSAKREWRGEWKSAVQRTNEGFVAEIRIPWRVLNYPSGATRNMDVEFRRFQARTLVSSSWPNTTIQSRPELRAQWIGVSPPAASLGKRLQTLLYAAPEFSQGDVGLRTGADFRYAVSPRVNALLSVGPDFKNIEQQIAGIDFTRTERFLDEARPFFTEGGDFFSLNGSFGFGQMFYSRRIDRFDAGSKVYGQITPNLSAAALATVDHGRETNVVARLGERFGPFASASVYATSHERYGFTNQTFGGGFYGRRGTFETNMNVAASRDGNGPATTAGDASVDYSAPHWFSLLRYEWVPPAFDPALAYIGWHDRRGAYFYTEYNSDYRTGPLRSLGWDLFCPNFQTYSGEGQQEGADVSMNLTTRNDIRLSLGRQHTRYFGLLDEIYSLGVTFNNSNRYRRLNLHTESGTRNDGIPSHYSSVDTSYRLFRGFDIGTSLGRLDYQGSDTLAIVTLGYEMSPTRSVTGRFVQRNGDTNAYVAFRNGGSSGTELYFIVGDPNATSTVARASVKVVWAF